MSFPETSALQATASPEPSLELAAEAITVRIRWFGLCLGYILVNFIQREVPNQPLMNGILSLGAIYTLLDTIWSVRGRVFLSEWPPIISLMEAVFIGLLCHFDTGVQSPFLVYYFLSLLTCAIRYSRELTFVTFLLHACSYSTLALAGRAGSRDEITTFVLVLIFLVWATWASTSLVELLKNAGRRLSALNDALRSNQALLEDRIRERTRELQQSQAQLVQHEKQAAFGLLAAGIAHEVGNPLAAISSLVQMLNRRNPDEHLREKLLLVDDQLRRIQGILRELIDFSRPATKERILCDVHEVINAALNIAKYYKRTKGKRILTRYATAIPKLRIARDQLVQVLLNLILNAMDATEEGGEIEISTALLQGWVQVSIRDNGHGIPAEIQPRIFEPYFTTKPTGTGLGLFVCRNIIEREVEGKIDLAESSPQGTRFVVSITCDNARQHPDVPESLSDAQREVDRG